MSPLAIDLFAGKGGWSHGLIAAGWQCIGFDIANMGGYPGELVLQDVLTLHGSQFRNADLIVASPPCQNYSYLAMPWSRSKDPNNSKAAKALRKKWETEGPDNRLFDACFRIQREACEAACHCACWRCARGGHCVRCDCFYNTGKHARHIPLVVENVKGAHLWVGRAKANYGSFYLWGDVETVNGAIVCGSMRFGVETLRCGKVGVKCGGPVGDDWFAKHNTDRFATGIKGLEGNPDGWAPEGTGNGSWFFGKRADPRDMRKTPDVNNGIKQGGEWWHDPDSMTRRFSSRSSARKEASARIAMIPPELARYVGEAFKPQCSPVSRASAPLVPSKTPRPAQ